MSGANSARWLREHERDPYVQAAQREGYRSRAAYKLLEIDQRDRLLRPGLLVLDLGAAPGAWSQIAAQRVGSKGGVIALDLLPMEALPGVNFLQADLREPSALDALADALDGRRAGLVLCDMAPNISGMEALDQPRSMRLADLTLDCAERFLAPDGHLLIKLFQGAGSEDWLRSARRHFARVIIRKPRASRPRSREVYALCREFKSEPNTHETALVV